MNAPAVISDIVILYNVHVLYCCEYTHSAICIKYMKHWLRPLAPPLLQLLVGWCAPDGPGQGGRSAGEVSAVTGGVTTRQYHHHQQVRAAN